jgi:hypothetical protein
LPTITSAPSRRAAASASSRSSKTRTGRPAAASRAPTREPTRPYQKLLDEGRYASISEMAVAERIERGYLGSLLRLTLLAPDIVESILDGRQPESITLLRLIEGFPERWAEHFPELRSAR